jgi:hypothetical protein
MPETPAGYVVPQTTAASVSAASREPLLSPEVVMVSVTPSGKGNVEMVVPEIPTLHRDTRVYVSTVGPCRVQSIAVGDAAVIITAVREGTT